MLDELQYTLDKSIDSDGNNGLEEENRALYNLTIAFSIYCKRNTRNGRFV